MPLRLCHFFYFLADAVALKSLHRQRVCTLSAAENSTDLTQPQKDKHEQLEAQAMQIWHESDRTRMQGVNLHGASSTNTLGWGVLALEHASPAWQLPHRKC